MLKHTTRLSHTFMLLLCAAFILAGCSKPEETFLEEYYRTLAKGDKDKLTEMSDFSMFTLTTLSHRAELQEKMGLLIAGMNQVYNMNGELTKVTVIEIEETDYNGDKLFIVKHDMTFKNGRTVTEKAALSKHNGKYKLFIPNEMAGY